MSRSGLIRRRLPPVPAKAGVELPIATVPSLEKLNVKAPKAIPFTGDDLLFFIDDLARSRAPRTTRKYGEKLQLGDIAVIDVLAYHQGKLVPFSPKQGMEVEVGAGDSLPWLDESLLECAVGDGLELDLTLPEDEPVEAMRGAEVTYLIDVVSAYRLELPAADSKEYVALLSRKKTSLEAVLPELSKKLENERIADAWQEARECVMDELVRRTEVNVSSSMKRSAAHGRVSSCHCWSERRSSPMSSVTRSMAGSVMSRPALKRSVAFVSHSPSKRSPRRNSSPSTPTP